MNKRQKALAILLTPFLLGFLLGFLVGGGCSRKERAPKQKKAQVDTVVRQQPPAGETEGQEDTLQLGDDVDGTGVTEAREIIYYTKLMSYGKVFDDINEVHLEKAKAVGLSRVPEKRDDLDPARLVKVENTDYLEIDELRHSVPYLTPGAARELNRIAKAFHDSLARKQFPIYKLVCTSILRTEEDVDRLRRSGNPNASDNSSHCYGTTFDISHSRYFRETENSFPFVLITVLYQ